MTTANDEFNPVSRGLLRRTDPYPKRLTLVPDQLPSSVHFRVCGAGYVVHVPNKKLAHVVRLMFSPYEVGQDELAEKPHTSFVVTELGDGFVVEVAGQSQPIRCGTMDEFVDGFEYCLTEAFLSAYQDRVHLHASGCLLDDSAVLALGRSGVGKSSLAAYWTVQGVPVMGDDVVLLNESGEVEPFKRQFKVDPTLLRKLGCDPTETPFWAPGSGEAWYDPAGGGGWAKASPVGLVAVIVFAKGESLSVRSLSRTDALNVMLHGGLDSGLHGAARFERLAAIVESVPLLEIQYGDILDLGAFLAERGKS